MGKVADSLRVLATLLRSAAPGPPIHRQFAGHLQHIHGKTITMVSSKFSQHNQSYEARKRDFRRFLGASVLNQTKMTIHGPMGHQVYGKPLVSRFSWETPPRNAGFERENHL